MRNSIHRIALTALAVLIVSSAQATPTIQTLSDSHGQYYLVNNGALANFQLYLTGALAGKITSINYNGQQMVGSKDLYYDIQGSPGIFLGSGETYSYRTGSNFIDISAFHPATATEPLDVTWHWILQDGQSAFSTYLTYHHTTAMADYFTNEQRLGAEFFNDSLFHYSSITDNFWGYQAASNADRSQGRFITAETSDMKGIPSEYTKTYETKYDWRSTYAQSGGVTGIVTAANTSAATGPLVADDYGAWSIENYRGYESWNAGPTHPQTPVADGASIIPSPSGSHFGGPGTTFTGNMDKAIGPILTYFNKGTDINSLRSDAEKFTTGASSTTQNIFYDSLNLPYYATTAQRGTVAGKVRLADGTSMTGATVVLSDFNAAAYAADPLSQEYQRHVNGYNYWVTPNADGTFTMPDVRPGTYRVTVIKPGNYREGTWDNITVTAGGTTNTGNLTWQPDVSGQGVWQIGTFDRTAGEFKHGNEYNNWVTTFNYAKDFPNGVNYTVNSSNPFNDKQNWASNWGLDQQNAGQDFWNVNFNLASAPAANSTVTITVAIAAQQFMNDLAALVYNASGTSYNRVDASVDHTADNAASVDRSGDTSSRVLYRKLTFPSSWLHAGSNKISFHIVGGNMQWDAVRLDISGPGTASVAQWNGGTGNWTDGTQWSTQQDGYTAINKGTSGIANDTSTTFADGATNTAPMNTTGSTPNVYDAIINGGTVNLNSSVAVQKFSLLEGTLNGSGNALTVNDTLVFGGGTFNGPGTISGQSAMTVNFANTISGGAHVLSTGAVTWIDGGTMNVTGSGSIWNASALSFGQGGPSSLSITSGGTMNVGIVAGAILTVGSQGSVTINSGTLGSGGINNAGTFSSTAGHVSIGGGSFTNSGTATIDGGLSGATVINNAGILNLSGTNTYTGATTVNGGVVQFGAATSIGGSGASVTVNAGGAVAFTPSITDSTFLGRINAASTGALALTGADAATNLNFTAAPLSGLSNMAIGAVGNVTYTGTYTPASGIYRLGGGGGTLTFSPLISGTSSVVIGNTGTTGSVILNATNNYSGTTTIKGGVLSVASLANGGLASPLGSSTNAAANLVIDGATLSSSGAATTDRLFTVGPTGATLDGSGGAMNWTTFSNLTASGSGNRTLTLSGSNTGNILSPSIVNPSIGVTSLTKDGSGKWTINSATNPYTGDTAVLNGTLALAVPTTHGSTAGSGNLAIATSGTFEMGNNNVSISALNDGPAPASGPGPNGNGGGTLSNSTGTSTLTIGNGNANGQFSGVISGGVNLIKTGTGIQIISGDNTYTGTTTINGGTIQIGVGGVPLSTGPGDGGFRGKLGAGNIIINATLVFNRGYLTTCTNVISGTGTLKQIANAELVLGSSNTYTGPTTIGGGIVNIGQGGPSDGTGLAYTGDCSLNASVLANGGATSSIGASTNAASNLILDGGTLFYTGSTTTTNRLFTVTQNGGAIYANGGLTFNNGGAIVFSGTGDRTLSLEGETPTACTFGNDIGDPTSGVTSLTKDRSCTWIMASTAVLTYSGDTNMNMGVLKFSVANQLPFGTGKGNVVFTTSTDFGSVYDPVLELNGFDQNINGLSGGLATYGSVDNNVGTHTLTVGNSNATATFNGILTGSLNLAKIGSGTQILSGANTYTGTTNITAGTLQFGNNTASGSVGSGAITNNGTLIFNRTDSYTVANPISGTGALTQAGSGTIILSGVNTFSGDTTITAGVLQLNNSLALQNSTLNHTGSATSFSFGSLTSATFGGLKGTQSLPLTNTAAGNVALTLGNNGLNNTYSGVLSGGGSITKVGIGMQILSGANSYTGTTTISGGTLQFGNATASGNVGGGAITDNGTLAFNRTDTYTVPNTISGSGGLIQAGAGTIILSAANSFSGDTKPTAGTLQLGNSLALQNSTLDLSSAGTINFGSLTSATLGGLKGNQSRALTNSSSAAVALTVGGNNASTTYSGALSGAGSLTKTGAGTLILSGANSYTGSTQINQGILQLGAADRLANTSSLVLNGGTLATAGFNETMSTLNLQANSNLDLGGGASVLHFAGSGGSTWNGALSIANWSGDWRNGNGTDQIVFGNSIGGLNGTQLNAIQFAGFPIGATILSSGEIVPATAPIPMAGDVNQDAHITVADISALMQALADLPDYQADNHLSDPAFHTVADVNGDGKINNLDIQYLIGLVATSASAPSGGDVPLGQSIPSGGQVLLSGNQTVLVNGPTVAAPASETVAPTAVPEPSSLMLAAVALIGLCIYRLRVVTAISSRGCF